MGISLFDYLELGIAELQIQSKLQLKRLSAACRSACHRILLWLEKSHQRKQLQHLSAEQLEDMGITKEMVKTEVSTPFWK